jgi:hypothetical protein
MKRRLTLILAGLAACLLILAVVGLMTRQPPQPPAPAPAPTPGPDAAASTPREAVVSYLEALYRKDFEMAYAYLSAGSREAHPFREFAERCESGEATNFDLAAAEAGPEEEGRATVTVPLVEDPAEAGFTTVREQGGWRVVYIGGAPWFPYP